jgi:hypothetical protein
VIKIDYINTGIDNARDFFGRERLIEDIRDRLKSRQSVSIYGERKIGKTSLLKYIFQVVIREMPLPDASQVIIIFQTFAGKQNISPETFLQLLYDELKIQLNGEKKVETINTYTFENFISTYYGKGKRFVFFFDELDASAENKGFDHAFFSYLRSLSETYDVQYIVASRKSIKQIVFETEVVSPFNGLFSGSTFKLGVFDEVEAYEFCRKLSTDALAGDTISGEAIIRIAGRHPFLIRLAYFHAVNLFIRSSDNRIDYDELKEIFEKESFYAYFYDVWSHMDTCERKLLENIYQNNVDTGLKRSDKDMLTDFVNNGLLRKTDKGKYEFVNMNFKELIQEWEPEMSPLTVPGRHNDFNGDVFSKKLRDVEESHLHPDTEKKKKGNVLEELVSYLFTSYKDRFEVRTQVSSRTSVLDLHLWFKHGDDPILKKFGDEIVVECKNWKDPAGKPEINDIAGDMVNRKCKTGILISRKGITGKDFRDANGQRLVWFHSEFDLIILVLNLDDLKSIARGKNLMELLKEKYVELVEG